MALGGGALLASCGSSGDSSTPSSAHTITVRDQRGKTIVLDGPARRIVTLPIPAASLLIAVDQSAEHLVGMHDASWVAMNDGIMGEMFPAALEIPHDVANDEFAPNVESILGMEPDLVVQWGDHGAELTAPLENAGITVAGLSLGTQDDVTTWVTLFADVLGKPERGQAIVSEIDSRLQAIQRIGSNRSTAAPKILYFFEFADGLSVAAGESYNDYYIKLIGAENPASSGSLGPSTGPVGVDPEQILAWDPDIVLLGNFDAAIPEDMYGDAVWKDMSAVKSRRVYKVPLGGYRWDPPGQESPLMWQWLSQVAFPQEGSGLREDIVGYYKFLYDQEPTSTQIDTMLWSGVNGGSADYDQFNAS